jgi:hypothetical protein
MTSKLTLLSGESDPPVVGFLSGSEVYNEATVNWTIASGSYTPHASCAEVVMCIMFRISSTDETESMTVTINSVAPDEIATFTNPHTTQGGVWVARWRGAPSGTVSITSEPGDSSSQWSSLLCYTMSLDTAVVFGDTALVDDDGTTATTTGDQTVTTEGTNSLLVFAVWADRDNNALGFAPDGTDTYDERYDGDSGGIGAGGSEGTVGTKSTTTASTAHTLEATWTNAEGHESKLIEMKVAP